jgi:hypothetical protein
LVWFFQLDWIGLVFSVGLDWFGFFSWIGLVWFFQLDWIGRFYVGLDLIWIRDFKELQHLLLIV